MLNSLARSYKIHFVETSAKNSNNIDQAFLQMAKNVMERLNATTAQKEKEKDKLKLNNSAPLTNSSNSSCC